MTAAITVVGGGLAGLIASVEAAEGGASVHLLEARRRLGGRATSTPGPFVANLGPHALYVGTTLWDWLRARGLADAAAMPARPDIAYRWHGRLHWEPPAVLLPAYGLHDVEAPIDEDLRTWATDRWGPDTACAIAGLAGNLTFDHDPGRLSAAFVVERIRRILQVPGGAARYVKGGWAAIAGHVAGRARDLGVRIELEAKVDGSGLADLRDAGPSWSPSTSTPRLAAHITSVAAIVAETGNVLSLDLRAERGLGADHRAARRVGLRVVALPVRDGQVPTAGQVDRFLEVVAHADGPVYLHCGPASAARGPWPAPTCCAPARPRPPAPWPATWPSDRPRWNSSPSWPPAPTITRPPLWSPSAAWPMPPAASGPPSTDAA